MALGGGSDTQLLSALRSATDKAYTMNDETERISLKNAGSKEKEAENSEAR